MPRSPQRRPSSVTSSGCRGAGGSRWTSGYVCGQAHDRCPLTAWKQCTAGGPVPRPCCQPWGRVRRRGELSEEGVSVPGVQVDLPAGAAGPEPHCLIRGGRRRGRLPGRRMGGTGGGHPGRGSCTGAPGAPAGSEGLQLPPGQQRRGKTPRTWLICCICAAERGAAPPRSNLILQCDILHALLTGICQPRGALTRSSEGAWP
jgi:hypothetical protein